MQYCICYKNSFGGGRDVSLQCFCSLLYFVFSQSHLFFFNSHLFFPHKKQNERFGPGPHKVEINIEFDPQTPEMNLSEEDRYGRMVIELASIDEMPHTVHMFLEQVSRQLFDGCSFHRNANHVIQAGPANSFKSDPNINYHRRFNDAGYASVVFQEYSEKYPHERYTLGYAGRPGGPDFYISMQDNSKLHGPGGQGSYEDPTEADPCFGKIIDGHHIADRIHQSPVQPGGYNRMMKYVAITSMRIL